VPTNRVSIYSKHGIETFSSRTNRTMTWKSLTWTGASVTTSVASTRRISLQLCLHQQYPKGISNLWTPLLDGTKEYSETQAISLHSRRWSSGTNGNVFGWQWLQHN
jgi:hypothetical protein